MRTTLDPETEFRKQKAAVACYRQFCDCETRHSSLAWTVCAPHPVPRSLLPLPLLGTRVEMGEGGKQAFIVAPTTCGKLRKQKSKGSFNCWPELGCGGNRPATFSPPLVSSCVGSPAGQSLSPVPPSGSSASSRLPVRTLRPCCIHTNRTHLAPPSEQKPGLRETLGTILDI